MMEVSFQGIRAALPSSGATSIKAEWLSVSSCWEVYGPAEEPAHLQEEGELNSNTMEDKKAQLYFHCT